MLYTRQLQVQNHTQKELANNGLFSSVVWCTFQQAQVLQWKMVPQQDLYALTETWISLCKQRLVISLDCLGGWNAPQAPQLAKNLFGMASISWMFLH